MYALRTKVEYQRLQKHFSCSRGSLRDLCFQRIVYLNQSIGPKLVVLFGAGYGTSRMWGELAGGNAFQEQVLRVHF